MDLADPDFAEGDAHVGADAHVGDLDVRGPGLSGAPALLLVL